MKNIIILISLLFAFIGQVEAQKRTYKKTVRINYSMRNCNQKIKPSSNVGTVANKFAGPQDHHNNRKLAATLAGMRHKTRKGSVDLLVAFYLIAALCFFVVGGSYGFLAGEKYGAVDKPNYQYSIVSTAGWTLGIVFLIAFMTASDDNNRQKVHDQSVFIKQLQHVIEGKVNKLDEAEWETRQLQDQIDSLERLHEEALYAVHYLSLRIDTLEGGKINGKVVPRSVLSLQK